jgi:branched-chain amino acid transport system ATP-binding protein
MGDLSVNNLAVVYHRRATAVQGVSFEVPDGQLVALLGVNGAGKTTTLRAIAGLLPGDNAEITEGTVEYDGRTLAGLAPHQVVQRGVVLVPEREKIFETLTVQENLEVPTGRDGRRGEMLDQVRELFPILAERARGLAGYLSGGERQMLAIARAMLCQPRLLLVDELTLGLAPRIVAELMERLVLLRERSGIAVLLVEQNVAAALEVADYGYVMEHGRVVFHGPAARLREHEEVQLTYLGLGASGTKSYRDVKQYRRSRRWWG